LDTLLPTSETEAIEGVYTLDRGTTTALIEHGFVVERVLQQSTDIAPARLLAILGDHRDAVEPVHDYIRTGMALTSFHIRELHACLLAHQDTHTVVSSLGQRGEHLLGKGQFRVYPNNPLQPDGTWHEYCPLSR